ncbi:importin-9 [Dorcoceras hygrometricum]|uniref:Importin-9 n=1 Tax=Dorcoceras hygrometricum TaxID=472368 RepID=A0A2Z7CYY2_9LAMI|nr:importin-9 [Dorcoceras hygrometricum]
MDQDQQWLINCLNASLDPDHQVRTFAEASLQQASSQSGFGVALAYIAANRKLSFGLRQISFLLKQYIKKHWNEDEEGFEHPVVSINEKASIRGILLSLLDDPHKKICTAVSVAVSTIAQYDWPDDWPDLAPFLLSLISDQSKLNAVHGAIRCLALISSDMDDKMVPKLIPVLFPSLLTIVSSPQIYDKCLRSKTLSIVYNCTSVLGVLSGVYKPWMEQFSSILKHPVPSEDPDDWSIRMEVLKCLNQFVQFFPAIADTNFTVIVGPLWHTFVTSLGVYERSSIEGVEDSYDGRYDSDGAEKSLESFVIQVHTWSLDANQYVADEDDNTYSCRVSGALLLEEITTSCGHEGLNAVIDSLQRRISESQQQKDSGAAGWWKMNQQVTEHFLYAAVKTVGMDVPPPVKVGACRALSELLPDSSGGILQPHALDLFSSLIDLLNNASDETMHLVLETLQAAVKAGHGILASIEPIISPIILNMWASHVSNPFISIDALEVLEAIKNATGCIHPLLSRVLPYIRPILSNPHQQPDGLVAASLDLVTMLVKNAPIDVVKAVHQVSFDSVVRIVLQSNDHSEMQEMNLIVLLYTDQNATQCLAALVSGGKQDLLVWSGDPGFTMRSLLDVASRLLDPDLESSGSLFVGSYILQLILHLPSQMVQHIHDLVIALIRRMQSSQIAGLKSSLLLIFARLVHMSVPHVEQFIDLLVSIPAEGHQNSFAYLKCELKNCLLHPEFVIKVYFSGEIQGAYQIKVTTTALALLLLTGHVELGNIKVQGHLTKSAAGITTRSKSKLVPDQWTLSPLPEKILALLADALLEIQEQVDGDNEDSDWEEVQSGDNEHKDGIDDFKYSVGAASQGRPTYEYLDAMAKAFEADQDDDFEDEYLSSADPLNEASLLYKIFINHLKTVAQFSVPINLFAPQSCR